MKKIFGILLLCLSIASCSLKETPYSDVTKDTFYRTPQQCEAALRGLYASANYIYDYKFLYAVEACSDLWETWANDDNARLLISPANPGIGSTVWKYAYIAIMRASITERSFVVFFIKSTSF